MKRQFLCIIMPFCQRTGFASATNHTITGVVISGEDNEPHQCFCICYHTDELKKSRSITNIFGYYH